LGCDFSWACGCRISPDAYWKRLMVVCAFAWLFACMLLRGRGHLLFALAIEMDTGPEHNACRRMNEESGLLLSAATP